MDVSIMPILGANRKIRKFAGTSHHVVKTFSGKSLKAFPIRQCR